MARTVRDSKLQTRAARERLKAGANLYWRTIIPGELHLGYRRRRKDAAGYWVMRKYLGQVSGGSPYRKETLAKADDFQDADGEHVLSFAEAQKLAVDRRHAAQGTRGPLTVAAAIADYIKFLRAERRTADDAEVRANALILPALGAIKVADLTTDRLLKWRDALAGNSSRLRTRPGKPQKHQPAPPTADAKRARQATANRTLTILKAALNRAFTNGLTDEDLAWRRLKPFMDVGAARPGYLSLAEATRLINAADRNSGFRALVHAALLTGCRYGELGALKVRDFHRGKLHVARSKSRKPRDVVLAEEGVAFFRQLTAGRAGDELMLLRFGRPWQKSDQARPMGEACRGAKISPPIGFHQLRHTWASHATMNGMPLMVVARNLGHASTNMVEKHYGHLAETYIDREVRAAAPKYGAVEPSNVVPLQRVK